MNIQRNTQVISISMPQEVVVKMEKNRSLSKQSRSAFISSLISNSFNEQRWQRIYQMGTKTAQEFKITSEDDIDRILHEPKD